MPFSPLNSDTQVIEDVKVNFYWWSSTSIYTILKFTFEDSKHLKSYELEDSIESFESKESSELLELRYFGYFD